MPTLWSHSMFWEQQPAQAMDREFLLVGVGRGAVISALVLGSPNLLWICLVGAVLMAQPTLSRKIRQKLIGWVVGDYSDLLGFLHSDDGIKARDALEQKAAWELDRPIAETRALDLAYMKAQSMGCKLSGWQLRFALYYWMGKKVGKW